MPLLPSHTLLQSYCLTLVATSYLLLTSPSTLLSSGPLWLLGEAMDIRAPWFGASHAESRASQKGFTTASATAPGGISLTPKGSFFSGFLGAQPDALDPVTREFFALLAFVLLLAALTQSIISTTLRYSASELTELASKSVNQARPKEARDDDTSAFAESLHTLHTSQTLFLLLAGIRVLFEGILIAWIYLAYSGRSTRTPSQLHNQGRQGVIAEETLASYGVLGIRLLANRVTFTVAMADMLFWGYLYTVLREEAREIAGILLRRRKMIEEQDN